MLQNYALERLAEQSEELRQVRDKHCSYYCSYLKDQEYSLRGPNQHFVQALIAADIDNIRSAWQWAVAQARIAELGALLESLHLFYFSRSWYHEAEQAFAAAVKCVKSMKIDNSALGEDEALTLSRLLSRQGRFAYRLGKGAISI